jgi:hypothetical protein
LIAFDRDEYGALSNRFFFQKIRLPGFLVLDMTLQSVSQSVFQPMAMSVATAEPWDMRCDRMDCRIHFSEPHHMWPYQGPYSLSDLSDHSVCMEGSVYLRSGGWSQSV